MCGIFGASGQLQKDVLVSLGCQNEKRGDDSCGIGWFNPTEGYQVAKVADHPLVGFPVLLQDGLNKATASGMMIGHTRQATMGKVNATNAHPFLMDGIVFAHNGIIFNHESTRRGLEFVTRKITDGIARIKLGLPQRETGKDHLELGNLHALRDWGFAGDYVKAMWLMLQQDKPDNYVIATGKDYSVRKFIEVAANAADIEIKWEGKGLDEKGFSSEGKKIIAVNETYFRPTEVHNLCGDSSKAKARLKWSPKVDFKQLVEMMIKADIERLKNNKI